MLLVVSQYQNSVMYVEKRTEYIRNSTTTIPLSFEYKTGRKHMIRFLAPKWSLHMADFVSDLAVAQRSMLESINYYYYVYHNLN